MSLMYTPGRASGLVRARHGDGHRPASCPPDTQTTDLQPPQGPPPRLPLRRVLPLPRPAVPRPAARPSRRRQLTCRPPPLPGAALRHPDWTETAGSVALPCLAWTSSAAAAPLQPVTPAPLGTGPGTEPPQSPAARRALAKPLQAQRRAGAGWTPVAEGSAAARPWPLGALCREGTRRVPLPH